MQTCVKCGREGSRGFADGEDGSVCTNTAQCDTRIRRAARALAAGRCVDCVQEGIDPKGTRKISMGADDRPHPGPRCVTHHRARKKDISAAAHEKRIEKNYELTAELYQAIYEAQDGRCFGCRKATGASKRLAVDHDHELAKTHGHDPDKGCIECIRALLCGPCNQIIGRLDVAALQRLILVLTDPPARKILLPGEPTAVPPDPSIAVEQPLAPALRDALDRADTSESWQHIVAADHGATEAASVEQFFRESTLTGSLFGPAVDGPPYASCAECDRPPCAIHDQIDVEPTDDPSIPEPTGDDVAIVDEIELEADAVTGVAMTDSWFDPALEFWAT